MSLLAAIVDRKSALDQRERELDSERQVWEQMLDRAKERENTLSEVRTFVCRTTLKLVYRDIHSCRTPGLHGRYANRLNLRRTQ